MSDRVARNTLHLTLASVGQKIIAFVYFLFLARVMKPELTGEYFLALSITTLYSVIAEFGITSVMIRDVARHPIQAHSFIPHALALKIPLVLVAIIGSILTGWLLGYDLDVQILIGLATLVLIVDATHIFFYGILRGFQALQYEAMGILLGMLTTASIGGIILVTHPSLPLLIGALVCGSMVNLLISLVHLASRVGWRTLIPRWSSHESARILKMALPFAMAAIFVKVYSYIDSILISKFLDTTAVGLYAVAYKFTYAFQFLPLAFVAALFPGMSAIATVDPRALETIFLRSIWYMALISAPIAFGLYSVAPEVVLLAGVAYHDAAPVLQTLIFVLIPIFLDFPIGSLLNASGKQTVKTIIMGLTMLINIALNLLFIPRFGVIGAAYTALISFWFMFAAGLSYVPTVIRSFSFLQLLKTILPIYSVGALMLVLVVWLKPMTGWIPVVFIGGIAYIAGLLMVKSLRLSDIWRIRHI